MVARIGYKKFESKFNVWCSFLHHLPLLCLRLLQHKECYFVGRTFFKLQNVSSQLEMKRFELYSHSTKHKRGYIKCSISLKRDVSVVL